MSIRIALLALAAVCAAAFVGCGDDDPAAPPATGTIVIDVQPDLAGAGWTLTRPGGGTVAGDADTTLTHMPTGSYALAWTPVADHATPATFNGELAADATLFLTGVYTWIDPDAAVIVIDVEPDEAGATWRLVREGQAGGIVGRGDGVEDHQIPGNYRVEWGDVVGWATPETLTLAVVSPETTTFTGLYEIDPAQYPQPLIAWTHDNPLPQGFPQQLRGSATDDVDGFMSPASFVWTSSLDGVVAAGVDTFVTDLLSVGDHVLELTATDSHGLTGAGTATVRIVAAPAQQPVVFIDRPAWGAYDVAQAAGPSPALGWDGSDPGSTSGHPAFVRFRLERAVLPGGGYATTRAQVEANLALYTHPASSEWSPWLPWDTDPAGRLINFPNLQVTDASLAVIQYVFAVQAWSETGAIGTAFTYAGNVAHFNALDP